MTDTVETPAIETPVVVTPAKQAAKKAPAKKSATSPAKVTKPATKKGATFTLADLARECGINPKIARAKARRHRAKLKIAEGADWVFPQSRHAEIKAFLTSK